VGGVTGVPAVSSSERQGLGPRGPRTGRLFLFGEKKITHSAHEAKTSKDHFERMESLLRNAGYGDDKVTYRRSTTEVSIFCTRPAARLHFFTRTATGGRGLGGDVVVLDEAYALTRDQMAALMPTMSARSATGNPQMWFTSSAGFADSDVLAGKKKQGENGADPRSRLLRLVGRSWR
jgi:hypothetical protein